MAIAQVQKNTGTSGGNTTSVAATFTSAPTQDNLLICAHHADAGSPTVTLPTNWSEAVTVLRSATGTRTTIGYRVAGASESSTVTVTTDASTSQGLSIFEYSGMSTTQGTVLDQTASNTTGGATSASTGTTLATAEADELVIAAIGLSGSGDGWGNAWTNSFVQQTTVADGSGAGWSDHTTAHRIATATGTFETTESWTTTRNSANVIATFKAGASGTTYTQTVAATSTVTPEISKQTTFTETLAVASTVTPAVAKLVRKTLDATTTVTAAFTKKMFSTLAATSTVTATLAESYIARRTVSATTTLTAALVALALGAAEPLSRLFQRSLTAMASVLRSGGTR